MFLCFEICDSVLSLQTSTVETRFSFPGLSAGVEGGKALETMMPGGVNN